MKLAAGGFQSLAQPVAIAVVVVVTEETRIPVVAPLHNVERQAGEMDTGATRH
ncbi:MAG TPA: hypothetical protein PLW81_15175 [Thiobacillaceae bacterium]|nr:hypothetical protein [Thiobacillaceae bacterium]